MFVGLVYGRAVRRQKCIASQLPQVSAQPDAPQANRDYHIQPMDMQGGQRESGGYVPEQLDPMDAQDQGGYGTQPARAAFNGSEQQEQERHGELKHQQQQSQPLPATGRAAQVPGGLGG